MRILIVEDNLGYAEALKAAVSLMSGYRVVGCVSSGTAALDFARRHSDSVDIGLLDLRLPEGSGLEILPQLKAVLTAGKIIVVSQSGKEHDVVQAIARGADGYLLKSSKVAAILDAIKSAAAGGTPIDAQIAGHLLGRFREQSKSNPNSGVLTSRELEILRLLADGQTKKEIATVLHVSYATVDSHVRNVYGKLNVRNAAEAIFKGSKSGTGTLVLSGANTFTGDLLLSGGTLRFDTGAALDSAIALRTSGTWAIDVDAAVTVDSLWSSGVQQEAGTWGAPGSGAANEDARFSGSSAFLTVISKPPRTVVRFR